VSSLAKRGIVSLLDRINRIDLIRCFFPFPKEREKDNPPCGGGYRDSCCVLRYFLLTSTPFGPKLLMRDVGAFAPLL